MALVRVISSDGAAFLVSQRLAKRSGKLKTEIETFRKSSDNSEAQPEIRIVTIRAEILRLVLQWLQQHQNDPVLPANQNEQDGRGDAEMGQSQWDRDFLAPMDLGIVMELILAANHLEVKGLLDITCKLVESKITGRTVDEIRTAFKLKSDFKGNEEEQTRLENRWCVEN
ncbi:unnamed protein product [Orchesella dallaii]|uniref:S-phase kinase-associated protein 1 n=1 Tax=Orchesella dallaii TaxID=48710 RepID=A0ABP1R9A7_9HEXA